ncbi:divergent polysaccharide deacetylase family protein [Caminibacter mediatlanticus]|uniref:Divergent polysaccharide deacetylase family protein n=1 Tax=Caminibacter mediatlanticus TB-2 TaxID=391592 RepID=A0AAI9AIX5_9BACT|nr:divergent polysaccharide deacetylase family protein [Caminibacter mediatlanticus]EDM24375.1 hypothetical protein CMTB2_02628 [Caminibacter mediatlanticus TB-2]
MKKQKTTKKRKITKKKQKNSKVLYFIMAFLIISIFASGIYLGYLLSKKETKKELKKYENTLLTLQKKINKLENETKKLKKTKNEHKVINSEIVDYKNSEKIIPPTIKTEPKKIKHNHKPKLVIIIDDVSFKYQTNLIKQIPYKITPSFFPPTNRHPNTIYLAKSFSHYMVHLPLEAKNYHKPEPNTITISSTYQEIYNRIVYLKKIFPKAKFMNNHTGSTFTSDKESMKKLFKVFKKENLGFVDSVTSANTKGELVDKIYNIPFYKRNIFLDNIQDKNYIRKQLLKAVMLAKKHGYAIAIGHPHKITLITLKNSKDILKNVDVVYIDELNKN